MNDTKDIVEDVKSSKRKWIYATAGIIVVVSIAIVVFAITILSNSKTILLQGIGNFSSDVKDFLEESQDFAKLANESKTYQVNSTLGLELGKDQKFKFTADIKEDKNKKQSQIEMGLSNNSNTLVGFDIVSTEKDLYFKVKNIIDEYLSIPSEYISLMQYAVDSKYSDVVDIALKNIKSNINSKDIKKSKEEITFNGKNKKVTKLSYTIDSSLVKRIIEDILKDIKDNKKVVKLLADQQDITEEEFLKQLNEVNVESINMTSFDYNVYYNGLNHILMDEIAVEENALRYYHDVEDYTKLEVYNSATKVSMVSLEFATEKDVTKVTGSVQGLFIIDGKITNKNDKSDFDFKVSTKAGDTVQQMLTLSGSYSEKEVSSKKQTLSLNLNLEMAGMPDTIHLTFDVTSAFDEDVKIADVSKSRPMDKLTAEELQGILGKAMEDPFVGMILKLFLTEM